VSANLFDAFKSHKMKIFRTCFVLFVFLCTSVLMNAQVVFVGADIALERLELKAKDVEESIANGEIKGADADIQQLVFSVMSNDLKQNNPVDVCIEAAFEKCYATFQDFTKEVDDFKAVIINLLKE
jgi:hypothetical protein